MVFHITQIPSNWQDPLFTAEEAAALLTQPGHILLGTDEGAHVLALVLPSMPADIFTLYTPSHHRRQGLARSLLQELMKEACATGCPTLTLEVRMTNTPAIMLYQSLGFTQAAIRRDYYTNPTEDALVLTRALG